MKLKVCGLNNPENIKEIVSLKPDFIGFIFYSGSKRFVSDKLNNEILAQIPHSVKKVGVFVDATLNEIIINYEKYNLDYVQLHGNEDNISCARLFLRRIPVIKAFKIDYDFDFRSMDAYAPFCSYFLFDTKADLPGGTGKKFHWDLLRNYDLRIPFFLSGGISPSDVNLIESLDFNMLYAIDINSRFEITPGIKDIEKVKKFKNDLKLKNQLVYENTNR